MHRNDNSNYFLYIEPSLEEKSSEPIDDVYTEAVQWALSNSLVGLFGSGTLNDRGDAKYFSVGNGWRGCHINCDGERSTNHDYLLDIGFITNSLCDHYTRWFRTAVDGPNLAKLEKLKNLYLQSK